MERMSDEGKESERFEIHRPARRTSNETETAPILKERRIVGREKER